MKKAIKNIGKIVYAYRLGDNTEIELRMIKEGLIRVSSDGSYELFSLEAVNGSGEIAQKGDYFKLSTDGHPYPNDKAFFEANHRQLDGNRYEQLPKPLEIWSSQDTLCPEIRFLQENKGLVIDPDSTDKRYSAPLWGTVLSAAADAVIVFYSITRDANGAVTDADFNFVAGDEFERT
ncbi:MAG: hypothetical protein IKU40_03745, partial [Clostridia bacterium]|nr:hypothetical protein [Clostridia bacterium]